MSDEPIISIRNLSRRFGASLALDNVTLDVPAGVVMGLVGENGAGKTTLIKHILGLLKPQTGLVRVFGKNPVSDPVGVLSQIGYLSEEGDLPLWMRVGELMSYTAGFYPTWDQPYADKLIDEFDLDPGAQLAKLSKGQRSRAGLVAAMAFRPPLLLLDEPSSGLDPIVRRDILGAIIRTIADEGRTVLFSSHLLGEVERVSDSLTMLKAGNVILSSSLDDLKRDHLRLNLRFEKPVVEPPNIGGAMAWEGAGTEWSAVFVGEPCQFEADVARLGAKIVERKRLSLDDIFLVHAGPPRRKVDA